MTTDHDCARYVSVLLAKTLGTQDDKITARYRMPVSQRHCTFVI